MAESGPQQAEDFVIEQAQLSTVDRIEITWLEGEMYKYDETKIETLRTRYSLNPTPKDEEYEEENRRAKEAKEKLGSGLRERQRLET